MKKWKALVGLCLVAFAMAAGAVWFVDRYLNPRVPGGDFELRGANGPVRLKDFRGKAVVIYFGYTSCPDVCPVSLSKLAQVLKPLDPALRSKIVPLFVSVDWRGDTAAKTQQYASFFLPEAKGATGSKAEIDDVVDRYGTSYVIEETPKTALGYSVQHSTSFYLVDTKGRYATKIGTELSGDQIKKTILELLN